MSPLEIAGEVGAVGVGARRLPFVGVAMNVGAHEVAEPARVIEVEVPQHHRVDVADRDADAGEQRRQPLFRLHLRRPEREAGRVVASGAQRRFGDLSVVASDVV